MAKQKKTYLIALLSSLLLFLTSCTNQPARTTDRDHSHSGSGFSFFHYTSKPLSLWQTIAENLTLDDDEISNLRVKREIDWDIAHKAYIIKIAQRAKPYLYYIYHQTQKRGLPAKLALLPILESAYDPFAYSHQGAAGLWQIMPGTASGFGIKQDWWYDGRRDIFESTNAALNYLSYLNTFFNGNWLLAIAAYDSGEGTVQQAVEHNAKRGLKTDYWSLQLPGETQNYIPRLLAFAYIIKHAKTLQLDLPFVADSPLITAVKIDSQIDLSQAAQMAGMSLGDLYNLNPGFNRWATDPNGPFRIILPIDKVDRFKLALSHLPKHKRVTWHRHTVAEGDSLSTIAKHYETTVPLIKQINKLPSSLIHVGKVILIPRNAKHPNAYIIHAEKRYLTPDNKLPGPVRAVHVVRHHETLWDIANEYHVKTRDLRFWNKLSSHAYLKPGQKLILWIKVPQQAHVSRKGLLYHVKAGDSLWQIAHDHHVSIKSLEHWNALKKDSALRPGQTLMIYHA